MLIEHGALVNPIGISLGHNGVIRIEIIDGINVWRVPKLPDKLYYDYQQKLNEIRAFGICFENNIESDCDGETTTILNVTLIFKIIPLILMR